MDNQQALKIIVALSKGVDPITGELLSTDNVIRQADVVSALNAASKAVEKQLAKKDKCSQLPCNAGKPWSISEDKQVSDAFDQNETIAEIAKKHGRTKGAIESRLIKLGKIILPAYDDHSSNAGPFDDALLSEREDKFNSADNESAFGKKCIECGEPIAIDRIKAIPKAKTCLSCQAETEKDHPEIVERKVVENGLAGSREDHKEMRSNQWRDIQQRNRGRD